MASLASYPNGLRIVAVVTLLLIFSVGSSSSSGGGRGNEEEKQRKMHLGSKPPNCENRCWNCRPCMAALVSPPHHKTTLSSKGDNENYYLLSWKCKCGDKYFQP
ncbi:hypothetical protein JCGZ_13343 [Jatropha curcas]|uniref:Epidermal patterning factor-like protein n=1 Tax=Jatropha curcas TaxID=180498 RepID=A0A067KBM4_JATCU|nr:EPIDERMAL PATTERNING FACTOR-like protein 8 [Jatropha curcas]KDP32418.1 hypothetical protein JCGZ_13343 [Jatropha curcas]